MAQIDPLIFGATVFVLVALTIFIPRLMRRGTEGPTADDVYLDSLPSRYEPRITVPDPQQASAQATPTESLPTPQGAPRAIAPTRQPATTAPAGGSPLAPLKLPVD